MCRGHFVTLTKTSLNSSELRENYLKTGVVASDVVLAGFL